MTKLAAPPQVGSPDGLRLGLGLGGGWLGHRVGHRVGRRFGAAVGKDGATASEEGGRRGLVNLLQYKLEKEERKGWEEREE